MRNLILIIIFSIIIIAIGLVLYLSRFNSFYSSSSEVWANFATFNGYFLSIINLIILGYISFITFRTTHIFNRLQVRPLLFITLDKPEQITGIFKDCWFINNGAKNAALNLIVRYTTNRNKPFTKWISCTSLGENQRLELFWVHRADKIEICFSDLNNEKFYSFEFMDYNGQTREITKKQYDIYLQQAVDNRDNNMTHLRDKFEKYISQEVNPMENYKKNFIDKILKYD